jgi:hypothetical protein
LNLYALTAPPSQWIGGALQLRIFQDAFRHQYQAVSFERFLDKVVGAAFNGGDSRLFIAVTGDHHDRQFGMLLLEVIEQLKTVQPAAAQSNVEENEIRLARNDSGQRFIAVARAVRVSCPSSCNIPATSSQISASSSTIRMSDAMVFAVDPAGSDQRICQRVKLFKLLNLSS